MQSGMLCMKNKGDELSKSSVVQYRYKVQKEGGSSDKF